MKQVDWDEEGMTKGFMGRGIMAALFLKYLFTNDTKHEPPLVTPKVRCFPSTPDWARSIETRSHCRYGRVINRISKMMMDIFISTYIYTYIYIYLFI